MRTLLIVPAALLLFCSARREPAAADATKPKAPSHGMAISSSAFENNGAIPTKYGCSGTSVSPPLAFAGAPDRTKSLALIVTDPDAPAGLFTHWVAWNIPASTTAVEEGHPPAGAVEGMNSYGKSGWGAPCPPNGEHRYVFTLYAVDTQLSLPPSAGREQLQSAMTGHVVAEAQLVGRYRR